MIERMRSKNSHFYEHLKNKNTVVQEKARVLSIAHNIDSDFKKVTFATEKLYQCVYRNYEIDSILKDFEICTINNTNDEFTRLYYNSKAFLGLVDCLSMYKDLYALKLLTLLEKIIKNNKYISKYLSKNNDFINMIMKYMLTKEYFEISIKICEDIFIHKSEMISVTELRHFLDIYNNNKISRLDTLCRILAFLVFDHKKVEYKMKFKCKELLKLKSHIKVSSINQSICINLPDFPAVIFNTLKKRVRQIISFQNNSVIYENHTQNLISELAMISALSSASFISNVNSNPESTNLNTLANNSDSNEIILENILNDSLASITSIPIYENLNDNTIFNEDEVDVISTDSIHQTFFHQTKTAFFKLNKKQLIKIMLETDIFETYQVNWQRFYMFRNKYKISQTYAEVMQIIKKHGPKLKINERHAQYLTYLKYTTYQIEMFFVLSTILGGKRKSDVQEFAAKNDIIKLMNEYIDYLDWGNSTDDDNRPSFSLHEVNIEDSSYHGKGCKCEVDIALKIQFLRLIYNYCCKDKNNIELKLDLFTSIDIEDYFCPKFILLFFNYFSKKLEEYAGRNITFTNEGDHLMKILNDINFKQVNVDNMIENLIIDSSNLSHLTKMVKGLGVNKDVIGLLKKLVLKYMVECPYSSSKFWLSSCIEVILRGNNNSIQLYVAQLGLMPVLLNDIIYNTSEKLTLLQMSFDVLAELVKFNKANFLLLNYYLNDNNEYEILCEKIKSKQYLVDSNVFLRSIILSKYKFEKFDNDNGVKPGNSFLINCKICSLVDKYIAEIFINLSELVNPDEINQTNISCINTSLIILILNYERGKLEDFLTIIRQNYPNSAKSLSNLKCLLVTWKMFYNYRSKDCESLEHSTSIKFNVWYKVTSILLEEDETKLASLYYKY